MNGPAGDRTAAEAKAKSDRTRTRRSISIIVAVFLLFTFTFTVFSYTVEVRRPWFGKLSPEHHQWLTGSTVKFAKNWWREGALNLGFTMFENPASAEFPSLDSRGAYISYPPGTVIPIYLAARLAGKEPGPPLVMAYNLLNHFLIALFLGLIVLIVLLDARFGVLCSFLFALIPVIVELLMPAPLYWHQNVYFSDQAVILPVVLFLFLEALRDASKGRMWMKGKRAGYALEFLQALVFFCGVLTDWLFYFVAAAVLVKRLLYGESGKGVARIFSRTLLFWLPALPALAVFAIQLRLFRYDIIGTFLFRSGLSQEGASYATGIMRTFWKEHVAQGYGRPAVYLLWFSGAACACILLVSLYRRVKRRRLERRRGNVAAMSVMLTLPFFVQVYTFKNHSVIHDFSALKFSLTLATVPFVLLPCLLLIRAEGRALSLPRRGERDVARCAGRHGKAIVRQVRMVAAIMLLVVAAVYARLEYPRFRSFFPEPGDYAVEAFIAKNTGYSDVVFSTDYEIPDNPPQQISYAMKRIYKVSSLSEIYEKVSGIEEDYFVGVLALDGVQEEREGDIGGLLGLARTVIRENGRLLYKVDKPAFLEYCSSQKNDEENVFREEGAFREGEAAAFEDAAGRASLQPPAE